MTQLYTGVVEDRTSDPLKLGRCKVRVFGLHTDNKADLPTKDLPWAIVMQPITSAANSGIGHAPVGPIEGTWVVVMFNDDYNQQPIIIGTLAGVPQTQSSVSYVNQATNWQTIDQTAITDSDGNQIVSEPAKEKAEAEQEQKVFKASSLSISENGISSLKKLEGLASIDKNKRTVGSDSLPLTTQLYAYKDTVGIWTIGWGSTTLSDGSKVTEFSVITKAEADSLFLKKLKEEFEPAVRRNVKVPITQSMYDSLVSIVYNGWTGIFKSPAGTALNSGKYKECAALIPDYKNSGGVLTGRREKEKALFIKDGYPNTDGDVEKAAVTEEEIKAQSDATQNPAVVKAVIDPTAFKAATELNNVTAEGFVDPNKIYPKWVNEPDTHRLARHENINKTVVYTKEAARAKDVTTSTGSSWNQPPIPYNAKYPFNHVYVSESGHVQEFDDSLGNERIHTYHKAGTYTEIDVNGTQVNRIVGDSYEVLERNGYVVVRGTCNVTISGNSNVRIENDSNIQVLGNANLNVTGDMKTAVSGKYQIHCGGEFHVDASKIYWNSQKASGISLPTESSVGEPSFGELVTPSRQDETNSNYETPEEGSNETFVEQAVKSGDIEKQDPTLEENKKEEVEVATKQPEPELTECGADIASGSPFTSSFKLSNNFSLGKVCTGKSGIPTGINYGLTDKEIVCNLRLLSVNCLERIIQKYPNMIITNTWRSEKVNNEVNGSKTSDHLFGRAADIQFSGFSRDKYYEVAQELQKLLPAFKQIILEYKGSTTWIHVAFDKNNNKMQCLTMDASRNAVLKSNGFMLV
jgi:GH24 family phage-related lysozyme (muramidase)